MADREGISVVAKASAARGFFASFFGLSKKEENKIIHGNSPKAKRS
jgi:hypothetical protein